METVILILIVLAAIVFMVYITIKAVKRAQDKKCAGGCLYCSESKKGKCPAGKFEKKLDEIQKKNLKT